MKEAVSGDLRANPNHAPPAAALAVAGGGAAIAASKSGSPQDESKAVVEDAAKLLAYHNISGMPVEDPDGNVVGIVSEADVCWRNRCSRPI